MYEQEVNGDGEARSHKAEGRDPHDVKQQDQVLGVDHDDWRLQIEDGERVNDLLAAVVSPGRARDARSRRSVFEIV